MRVRQPRFVMPLVERFLHQFQITLAGRVSRQLHTRGTQPSRYILTENETIPANEADEVHRGITAQPTALFF